MAATAVRIDVGAVAPAGVRCCALDVFTPPSLPAGPAPVVAFCLPGGWCSRRYFDLDPPPEHGSYSMARHLAARGLVVVTVDPPGIGGSDAPDDGYDLTPDRLADTMAFVTAAVVARLATGDLVPELVPLPQVRPVGVGHSAGALLTVYEQARHRPFAGLALLGFAGRGLVEHLTPIERALAGDPAGCRAALADLVRERFGEPLPPFRAHTTSIFSGGPAPQPVKDAMRRAQDRLLALLGLTAMIPGASAPELAAIDVPVFLGVGDGDITGPPERIPGDLPHAGDVTLFVLEGSGHAHNVAARRAALWDALADWSGRLQVPDP